VHRKREIWDSRLITYDVSLSSVINLFDNSTRILILVACTTQFLEAIFDSLDDERDLFDLMSRHARLQFALNDFLNIVVKSEEKIIRSLRFRQELE
jgi:hypothetical protein